MSPSRPFPLNGVIGVVAESADEVADASARGLQCVELRADLLLDRGLSESDLYQLITLCKAQQLGVLFTLRHPDHGGAFGGSESERLAMSLKAAECGADLFDLEVGTEAAAMLPADAPPMILSYHDFHGMPTAVELHELTAQMENTEACAIKVVPTAARLEDALTMLKWVGRDNGSTSRIGFAMGEFGACSRILTTALGGKLTYASFGSPVAPGQIDMDELLSQYRVDTFNQLTRVIAVCADGDAGRERVAQINANEKSSHRVAVAFPASERALIDACSQWLKIDEIIS